VDLENSLDEKWDGKSDFTIFNNSKILDEENQIVFEVKYIGNTAGNFFDFKQMISIGVDNHIIDIKGTISSPLILKNDTSIQAYDSDYLNKLNLISRTNGVDYDNEVIIGDAGVKTAIRVENNTYDAVIRKGTYGSTTDYLIYTSEFFDYNDLSFVGHTHNIAEIPTLQDELDNRLNKGGDTANGVINFDERIVLRNNQTALSFNQIPDGGVVFIDNGSSGDKIIEIEKFDNLLNPFQIRFRGQVWGNYPLSNNALTTK
jgi:hypothetical protein